MSGITLIITFVIAIVVMILAISKWKIHPFLAIMGISLILAIVAGIPLSEIPGLIGTGFSGTFKSIGIVIILGALIGTILEKTGAALKLAEMVARLVGPKHPDLAMEIMGWVVSIPVFCDSGFVILAPIRKALTQKTHYSSVAMTMCLSAGLYVAHVFIPPTPGPIAAAGTLGIGNNIIGVIGMGALVSIPVLIAAYFFANKVGKKVKSSEDLEEDNGPSYEDLLNSFIGLLASSGKMSEFNEMTGDTLKIVGPILFITAAGGVLGKTIAGAGFVEYMKANAEVLAAVGIFFPFIVSAILKSAQGSSTVAITTTAGIMGSVLDSGSMMNLLGLNSPMAAVLTVLAIGAGAMTVSHANDSYFWVVTNFGGLTPEDGYKTQTSMTLVMGVVAILFIWILSLFLI